MRRARDGGNGGRCRRLYVDPRARELRYHGDSIPAVRCPMNPTIDILRAELERLFSLDEMTSMSQRLLGLDPEEVGGATAQGQLRPGPHRALPRRRPARRARRRHPRLAPGSRPAGRATSRASSARTRSRTAASSGPSSSCGSSARASSRSSTRVARKRGAARAQGAAARGLPRQARRAALPHRQPHGRGDRPPRAAARGSRPASPTARTGSATSSSTRSRSARASRVRARCTSTTLRPILRGILEPLAALHRARIAHGDLKLENVLVGHGDGGPHVTLIDFGTDRLRQRPTVANGHTGVLAVFGSPKTIAPEQVRGHRADAATDLYAFGAMMYELLIGQARLRVRAATDAAFAHVASTPEPPSAKAPRGWVTSDVDEFVLSLLAKDPGKRPKDAAAVLDELESLGRASAAHARGARRLPRGPAHPAGRPAHRRARTTPRPPTRSRRRSRRAPIPRRSPRRSTSPPKGRRRRGPRALEVKKSLLLRAARIFDESARTRSGAERAYAEIVELDPEDRRGPDRPRRGRARRSASTPRSSSRSSRGASRAAPGEERARIFAEIGRLCATELEDPDQGILAYARALCEAPTTRRVAEEIERLAEGKPPLWNEVLATLTEGIQGGGLRPTDRNALLVYAARWYDAEARSPGPGAARLPADPRRPIPPARTPTKGSRASTARRSSGRSSSRSLVARADAAGNSPARPRPPRRGGRDLRGAAERRGARRRRLRARSSPRTRATRRRATGWPASPRAPATSRRSSRILERRAEPRRGREKAEALLKIAEVYEDQLERPRPRPSALRGGARRSTRTTSPRSRASTASTTARASTASCSTTSSGRSRSRPRRGRRSTCTSAWRRSTTRSSSITSARPSASRRSSRSTRPTTRALTTLRATTAPSARWESSSELYEKHARVTDDDGAQGRAPDAAGPRPRRQHRLARAGDARLRAGARAAARTRRRRSRRSRGCASRRATRARRSSAIEALAAKAATPEAQGRAVGARGAPARGARRSRRRHRALQARLEANPRDAATPSALRQAYAARGDAASVVKLIERELALAEGKMAKARLHGELARVLRDKLYADDEAERHAKTAIELDPTNADALLVLGDIAFERRALRRGDASTSSRSSAARRIAAEGRRACARSSASSRATAAARRRCASSPSLERSGESAAASISESHPRIASAARRRSSRSRPTTPTRSRAWRRVMFDSGDVERGAARRTSGCSSGTATSCRAPTAPTRSGASASRCAALGELDKAVDLLREAADADPGNPAPLNALARVYEQTGDWEEFVRTKRRRLEVAIGGERFELLARDRRRRVQEAEQPRARRQDVRRRARRAARRPQAPDQADAALLGGEGLGEASSRSCCASPTSSRIRSSAPSTCTRRRSSPRGSSARSTRRSTFYDARHRVRPDARPRRWTRRSSCAGRRATTRASSGCSRSQLEQAKQAQDRAKIVQRARPARASSTASS